MPAKSGPRRAKPRALIVTRIFGIDKSPDKRMVIIEKVGWPIAQAKPGPAAVKVEPLGNWGLCSHQRIPPRIYPTMWERETRINVA